MHINAFFPHNSLYIKKKYVCNDKIEELDIYDTKYEVHNKYYKIC